MTGLVLFFKNMGKYYGAASQILNAHHLSRISLPFRKFAGTIEKVFANSVSTTCTIISMFGRTILWQE